MSTHAYRRQGGEKKVQNSVYVECERPLTEIHCEDIISLDKKVSRQENTHKKEQGGASKA